MYYVRHNMSKTYEKRKLCYSARHKHHTLEMGYLKKYIVLNFYV